MNQNPKNQASLIWNIADILRGGWKQYEYQNVILPLVVLKRIDSVLQPEKEAVIQKHTQMVGRVSDDGLDNFLKSAANRQFYNTSPYDFTKLLEDSDNVYTCSKYTAGHVWSGLETFYRQKGMGAMS